MHSTSPQLQIMRHGQGLDEKVVLTDPSRGIAAIVHGALSERTRGLAEWRFTLSALIPKDHPRRPPVSSGREEPEGVRLLDTLSSPFSSRSVAERIAQATIERMDADALRDRLLDRAWRHHLDRVAGDYFRRLPDAGAAVRLEALRRAVAHDPDLRAAFSDLPAPPPPDAHSKRTVL